jgi:tetratricopeptide (TPR) repeat protein
MPLTSILSLFFAAGLSIAAHPQPAPSTLNGIAGDPLRDLRDRADRERAAPVEAARLLPPPPGLDAAAVRPLPPAERSSQSKAGMPLAAVLAAIGEKGPPASLAPLEPEASDDEARTDAMKLYASARLRAADGNHAEALADLQEAAKLDPSSAPVWRSIAEAQGALGRRAAAVAAMQQAVRRGLRDDAALATLGREAARALRADEAAWLLAMVHRRDPAAPVPALLLAEALDQSGYAGASAELLAAGLSSPALAPDALRSTSPDLAEILRRRGELWQRAGDAAMRLDRPADAERAYGQAAALSPPDPGSLTLRRVAASLRMGRPAAAALAAADAFAVGTPQDRDLALLRFLADNTDVGPMLAPAIESALAASQDSEDTPTRRSLLARSRAAALPLDARRAALVNHLSSDPADRRAAADLIAGFPPTDLPSRDRALALLVDRRPESVDAVATLILADGRGVASSMEAMSRSSDPAAVMLGSYLKAALGRPAEAMNQLKPEAAPARLRAALLGAKADLAGLAGDYAEARRVLGVLESLSLADSRWARARALAAIQRHAEALAAVADAETDATSDQRLLIAALALQAGDFDRAERLLTELFEADPRDDRSAEPLLRLLTRGPKADAVKAARLVQRLRDSGSRVLRLAAAAELVQRSQWAAAEQGLIALAEEDPSTVGLLDSLATVWSRGGTAAQDRGRIWLEARLAAAPESVEAIPALAQILAAQGQVERAVALLDEATKANTMERLRRLREILTADKLGKPDDARRLAVERLAPAPRTIDQSLSLAEMLIGLSRVAEVEPIFTAFPDFVPLTDDQKSRAARVASALVLADADLAAQGKPSASDWVLPWLAKNSIEPDAAVRESGLILLTFAELPNLRAIADAFRSLTTNEAQELQVLARLAQRLLASPKPAAILPLFEAVVTHPGAGRNAEPRSEVLIFLSEFVGRFGSGPDLRRILPLITKGRRAEIILDQMAQDAEPPPPPPKQPGMVAYRIAGVASNLDRHAQAASLYEIALELDPDHALAHNDYGYMLLEHGPNTTAEERSKIERLLERAYELNPKSYNIVDSLGWLRYKQNRLADDPDKGAIAGAGAISLLRRSAELQFREQDDFADPFIVDHLGDALWRAGDKNEALRQWRLAESRGETLMRLRPDNLDNDAYGKLLRSTEAAAAAKVQAVNDANDPPIAPQWP